MSDPCPQPGALVEEVMGRLATQYREAANLKAYLRTILGQVDDAIRVTCEIPRFFDLDSATADQLTLIGKRMGWPRCHCVCDVTPVFGFACEDEPSPYPIAGFCEDGTWLRCGEVDAGQLCLNDDEVYRAFLKARRYQMLGLFDIRSLEAAMRHIWGQQAFVADAGRGRIVIAPMRALTAQEMREVPLVVRVLPVAPGIRVMIHYGTEPIFGFGTGWGGFCEFLPEVTRFGFDCGGEPVAGFCDGGTTWAGCEVGGEGTDWLCPENPYAYECPSEELLFQFGFECGDGGVAGFCEPKQTWAACPDAT